MDINIFPVGYLYFLGKNSLKKMELRWICQDRHSCTQVQVDEHVWM